MPFGVFAGLEIILLVRLDLARRKEDEYYDEVMEEFWEEVEELIHNFLTFVGPNVRTLSVA